MEVSCGGIVLNMSSPVIACQVDWSLSIAIALVPLISPSSIRYESYSSLISISILADLVWKYANLRVVFDVLNQ